MIVKNIKLENEDGLHARPAANLVKIAKQYESSVKLDISGKEYNAKSILSIMSAGIKKGTDIKIICEGKDEKKAIESIVIGFKNKFDE